MRFPVEQIESAIAAIVAVMYGLYHLTTARARQAERDYPPSGRFVAADGVRLHYVRAGSGPVLLLLHGSDGFLDDYTLTVFEQLAAKYDVIAIDRPGHGYSEADPFGAAPETQIRLIMRALRSLGVERPLVAAHSWSAVPTLQLVLTNPDAVSALILIAPWVYPPTSPLPMLRLPQIPIIGPLLSATLLTIVKPSLVRYHLAQAFHPAQVPNEYRRRATALWQRWPWQTRTFAEENTRARSTLLTLPSRYWEITTPIVIIAGRLDRAVAFEAHALRLSEQLPNATLRTIAEGGHELPRTHPNEVIAAIDEAARLANTGAEIQAGRSAPVNDSDWSRARALVYRYGWNATAYQILNPSIKRWFSSDGEAVIGYVRSRHFRVAAGAPVCAFERLQDAALEFEQDATSAGDRVCWFGAAERLRDAMTTHEPHAALTIGAQPVWNPQRWPEIVRKNSSLRAQINRAGNKGMRVEEWSGEPAQDTKPLQACLDEWLARHSLPPLEFLTAPVSLAHLADRRIFVGISEGLPVAFLIATPVPYRKGWLIEQIVRGDAAPNGSVERLVDAAMRALGEDGADYVTLGLAPLSRRAPAQPHDAATSGVRVTLAWARAHGRRFYNFDGLDAFKAKFRPDAWEPLYAIVNKDSFTIGALYAIAGAFSHVSPLLVVLRAMGGAFRQEVSWLRSRLPH